MGRERDEIWILPRYGMMGTLQALPAKRSGGESPVYGQNRVMYGKATGTMTVMG